MSPTYLLTSFHLKTLDTHKGPIFVQGSVFIQDPTASKPPIWGDPGVPKLLLP